jgi:hypothetical protein
MINDPVQRQMFLEGMVKATGQMLGSLNTKLESMRRTDQYAKLLPYLETNLNGLSFISD